ncbi:MAG: PAS domain-containing sensor histidine kinase [Candidatus Lokiarchaeota archaeon]|nr:PAS domain-containing sensor histidine kinase [Candidatus Lokiarchaeota archaeon]
MFNLNQDIDNDKDENSDKKRLNLSISKEFVRSAPFPIIILNNQLKIFDINNIGEKLFKTKKKEAIGKKLKFLIPYLENVEILPKILEVLKTGVPCIFKTIKLFPDSVDKYCIQAFKSGNFLGVVFLNSTECDEKERSIRYQRDRALKYLDIAGTILVALDEKGTITLLNKKGHEVLGYKDGVLVGKNWFDTCLPKTESHQVRAVFEKLISGEMERVEFYDNHVITKDGTLRMIAWHNSFILSEEGNIIEIVSSGVDITERKKVENQVRLLASAVEQASVGIEITDLSGNVQFINNAFASAHDFSPEELIGKNISIFHTSEQMDDVNNSMDHTRKKGEFIGEIWHVKRDGTIFPTMMHNALLRDENGEVIFMIGTMRDITEQKILETELRKISDFKTDLLRRTSHELKTPLISILGFTNLLLELHSSNLDEKMISILNEIRHGCFRMETIVNSLLKSSKLDSKSKKLKKEKENLSFLVKFCVNELNGLIEERKLNLSVDLLEDMFVEIVKEDIYDVVSHLIINAIKYTPSGGAIKIYSEVEDEFYILNVEDSGIGIIFEERERLFHKFGKIEHYGKGWDIGIEGLGLGLYNSKKIIEFHDGEMWAESRGRNLGSKFSFSLPIFKE